MFFETSAKTSENVAAVFEGIGECDLHVLELPLLATCEAHHQAHCPLPLHYSQEAAARETKADQAERLERQPSGTAGWSYRWMCLLMDSDLTAFSSLPRFFIVSMPDDRTQIPFFALRLIVRFSHTFAVDGLVWEDTVVSTFVVRASSACVQSVQNYSSMSDALFLNHATLLRHTGRGDVRGAD